MLELLRSDDASVAGGTLRNRRWLEPVVDWAGAVPEVNRWVLCDAMTSGGLLIAARPDSGAPGARIGSLHAGAAGAIRVE